MYWKVLPVCKLLPAGVSSEVLLKRYIGVVISGQDVQGGTRRRRFPFNTAELREPPVSQPCARSAN